MRIPNCVVLALLILRICSMEASAGRPPAGPRRLSSSAAEGDFRSVSSGNWNSTQTWERFNGESWSAPASAPDSGAGEITIRSGHTVALTAPTTYDQVTVETGAQVTIAAGVAHTLTDGAGDDLTIDGIWLNQGSTWTIAGGARWVISNGGTYIHNTSSAFSAVLSKGILKEASNFIYRGSSSLVPSSSFAGRTYGNLAFESTLGQWTCTSSGSSPLSVGGSLRIGNGVKWSTGGFSGAISIGGESEIEGEWSGGGAGNLASHTFHGTVRIASGGRYQLNTSGTTQGTMVLRGDFVNNGVFASPTNRVILFDGMALQSISGSSVTSFETGLAANQSICVTAGAEVRIGAGKSLIANRDVEVFGTLSGADPGSMCVLAGAGNQLTLEGGTLSIRTVIARDGMTHTIVGDGVLAGCVVKADSASRIVLDAHLTLTDGALDASSGEILPAPGSTIVYCGSSQRPICPLRYWNLEVVSAPGATLMAQTIVCGTLKLSAGPLTTGPFDLVLGPAAILQEIGSGSVIGRAKTTRLPKRGIKEDFSGMGLELLTTADRADSVTLCRVTGIAPLVRGGAAIPKYFTIGVHGKTLDASLAVHYTSRELMGKNAAALRLLQSTDGGVNWHIQSAPADTSGGTLTYSGYVEDSRWTIAEMSPPPALATVIPSSARQGECVTITLSGTAFDSGVTELAFSGKGVTVKSIRSLSSKVCVVEIIVDEGADKGTRDISLSTWTGTAILRDGFEILRAPNPTPTLARVSPSFGTRGKTTQVMLYGSGLLGKETVVNFGDSICVRSAHALENSIALEIVIAAGAAAGLRDVSVSNPGPGGGTATLQAAFLVANPVPVAAGIYPGEASCGETRELILEGSDFVDGVSTVHLGEDIEVDSIRALSCSRMKVYVKVAPNALSGFRDVSVVNASPGGGEAVLQRGFRVTLPLPTISSFTPAMGVRGASMRISLEGAHFLPGVSSLNLGEDLAVDSLIVMSAERMNGILRIPPGARLGPHSVTIINSGPGGGSLTLMQAFEVRNPTPTLSRVSPQAALLGQHVEVVIGGSGFINGVVSVDFGPGICVKSTSCDSAGTHLIATVEIPAAAVDRVRSVTVVSEGPGGGIAVLPDAFTIQNPVPEIVEIIPAGCPGGRSSTVTVTGKNFLPGLTKVGFGPGVFADTPVVLSAMKMSVRVIVDSNAVLGARGVTVTNPVPGGGCAILPHVFNVETSEPMIVRVSPRSIRRGERLRVSMEGANFSPMVSRLSFGEGLRVDSVEVQSGNNVRAILVASVDAVIGSRDVSVFNPPPGGGTSVLVNGFSVEAALVSEAGSEIRVVPQEFELLDPYPNPFNPSTRFRFALPERSRTRLSVYNTIGVLIAHVIDDERNAGLHEVRWRPANTPSGVYVLRLEAESLISIRKFNACKRILLLK